METMIVWTHLIVFLVALAIVILTVMAIFRTLRESVFSRGGKIYWIVILLVLPVIGLGVWFVYRRRIQAAALDGQRDTTVV